MSATAAPHRAALEVADVCAPREGLASATAAPHRAAVEVAEVREENPVVEEDKACDENTPVDGVVKSCAEAKSCVVHGVDEAEAHA